MRILKPSEQSIETRKRLAAILRETMPIPETGDMPEHRHEQDWNIGDDLVDDDEAETQEAEREDA